MSFKNFRIIYHLFSWITGLIILSILGVFIFNTYEYIISNPKVIGYLSSFKETEDHMKEIKVFIFSWLWSAMYVSLKVIFLMMVRGLFRSLPIWSNWIVFWDNENEIEPILGRKITEHLRYKRYLNFHQLMECYRSSQLEAGMLSYHVNKLEAFFKKYDSLYDKENLKK